MLVTFVVEIGLLFYVLLRYKLTPLTRLVSGILFCLGLFQLAEYYVCGGLGWNTTQWSQLGYVAITMLPPLGLHLCYTIAKRPASRIVWLAYGSAAVWSSLFLFGNQVFAGYQCTGNYVIFQLRDTIGTFYSLYYYILLLTAVVLAQYFARRVSPRRRKALNRLVVGYALFMIPTAIVNSVAPATIDGIPIIMCGFAVLFALALVFQVLPVTSAKQLKLSKKHVR